MAYPNTAIVLAGGAGVRLRPLTNDIPKGLVRVAGKPLLQWVVEWLRDSDVSNLVIGVAYLKEKIMRYFGDGHKFGVSIRYSTHSVEGGTGEGFRLASSRYVDDESFFAMNGDQITDLNLRFLFKAHTSKRALATIAGVHPTLPFGLLLKDRSGYCKGFVEKPSMRSILCSSGIYLFEKEIDAYFPKKGDLEKSTFPILARERRLGIYEHRGVFLTVNSLREFEEADREMTKWKPEKTS